MTTAKNQIKEMQDVITLMEKKGQQNTRLYKLAVKGLQKLEANPPEETDKPEEPVCNIVRKDNGYFVVEGTDLYIVNVHSSVHVEGLSGWSKEQVLPNARLELKKQDLV